MKTDLGSLTYLLFLIVFGSIQARQLIKNRKSEMQWDDRDMVEAVMSYVTPVGFVVIPVLYLFTPLFDFAARGFHPAIYGLGVLCGLASIIVFLKAHADLGRNWSHTLQVKSDQTLIENGIYRYVRHPIYSALWVYSLAQLFLIPNWIAGASYLLAFSILYATRVGAEEAMMKEAFGSSYDAYMQRTGRLLPRLFGKRG